MDGIDNAIFYACIKQRISNEKRLKSYAILKSHPAKYRAYLERISSWRMENKERVLSASKRYADKNRENERARGRIYSAKNKARLSAKAKAYNSLPETKKMVRERIKARHASDPIFRMKCSCRKRVRAFIIGETKSNLTMEMLGCGWDGVKRHLESQFTPGMTWENYGRWGWHIDHIRPCASFDLSDRKQVLECFNFKNLQPLWWHDNISKGDKLTWQSAE